MGLFKRVESGRWFAQYTDHTGKRIKRSTGTRDKRLATQVLAKWEAEEHRLKVGLSDPTELAIEASSQISLGQHIKDWLTSLELQGNSQQYLDENEKRWTKIIAFTNWTQLAEVNSSKLEAFCVELRKSGRYESSKSRSLRTAAQYIQTAKGFTKWCVRKKRLPADPLSDLRKPSADSDRRLERRMLLPDEWPWLKSSVRRGECYGVDVDNRLFLYELAIQTGLRAKELRSLKVLNCNLAAGSPYVTVKGDQTKNAKAAKQYMTKDLAKKLEVWVAGRNKREPLFDLCYPTNMARMLKKDCVTARSLWLDQTPKASKERLRRAESDFLAVENDDGEQLDFHALRHTCGAWLAIRGVHPKTIQAVMRHSTITLTLDTYGHLMPGVEIGAVAEIGKLLAEHPEAT